jgi:myo-inositol catabolism protein IolC
MMTLDRFEDLAGQYGADVTVWPEAERVLALAFMAAHPEAASTALAQARALNALLESARDSAPEATLYDAVIASAPAAHDAVPRWSAMAAAAALLVGVSAGWLTTGTPLPEEEVLFERAFAVLAEDETDWLEEAAR